MLTTCVASVAPSSTVVVSTMSNVLPVSSTPSFTNTALSAYANVFAIASAPVMISAVVSMLPLVVSMLVAPALANTPVSSNTNVCSTASVAATSNAVVLTADTIVGCTELALISSCAGSLLVSVALTPLFCNSKMYALPASEPLSKTTGVWSSKGAPAII